MSEINPITREEMFLAAASGQNIQLPEPITRVEMFLAKIAAGGGTGGGTSAPSDWNAAEGEPGHVKHRTHWVDFEPVALAENITMSSGSQYSNVYYNAVKDSDVVTVIYDGVTYVCPVTLVKDITEFGDESYFYIGNFRNAAPDYPFSFWGYIGNRFSMFTAENGDHVLSVYVQQEKAVHKLDKKFLPETESEIPFIDLVALGMPAVGINATQNIDVGGEQLKALMEKGPFKYKTLFSLGEGMTFEVVAAVNPFYVAVAGLYQATALCNLSGSPLLVNLVPNGDGIQIVTQVIGGEYPTWNGGSY